MGCPPHFIRSSCLERMASTMEKPSTLRAEPRISSSIPERRMQGFLYRSTKRAAMIPTTP